MGAAVPYAICTKFAHPDRPVIALVGMAPCNEQHERTHHSAEILEALAGSTLDRMSVQQSGSQRSHLEQRVIEQSKVRCLTAHLRLRIRQLQRDARIQGYLRNDRLASAWQEALSSDRPMVLEVKTDPEVAPLHRRNRKAVVEGLPPKRNERSVSHYPSDFRARAS
jgi:pyruvate dehydrogenase (quinone)